MMDMANTTGFSSSFLMLWGIHIFSVIVFGVGLLFIIFWAFKTLSHDKLRSWGIGLLVGGTILCLITISAIGQPWTSAMHSRSMMQDGMMKGGMMQDGMMKGGMMKGGMDDPMSMSMHDMSGMLEGKTGDAFDRAFIEGMIPHHQGAIDMAKAALRDAKHKEIKDMAEAIIKAQQSEIDMMNRWMREWGYAG